MKDVRHAIAGATGRPSFGATRNAAFDRIYTAILGEGARKDGISFVASGFIASTRAIAIRGHAWRSTLDHCQLIVNRHDKLGHRLPSRRARCLAREGGAIASLPRFEIAFCKGGPTIARATGLQKGFDFLRKQATKLLHLLRGAGRANKVTETR